MNTADFIARADGIGTLGASFYFDAATVATARAHGLDGFRFYFLGRGGVLGDVEAPVVASAFGYFEPGLVAKMWDSARTKVAPRVGGRLYLGCCHDFARARFADVEGLGEFCAAAEQVNAAIEPAALTLYAGVDAEPVPDDLPARALHLCVLLREARGCAHLVGVVASGLSPRVAHAIKRPDDVQTFGWPPAPEITDDDRARWDHAEALTNQQLVPAFGGLEEAGQRALLDGLEGMSAALAH